MLAELAILSQRRHGVMVRLFKSPGADKLADARTCDRSQNGQQLWLLTPKIACAVVHRRRGP